MICDRRVPARIKVKMCKLAVRPAMLFGLDSDEKAGSGNGGGIVEDVTILTRSDNSGLYHK